MTGNADFSDNVGIGTASPAHKLDVVGAANATQLCIAGDCKSVWPSVTSQWTTSGANVFYNSGNVGIGTTNPGQTLSVNGLASATTLRATGLAVAGAFGPSAEVGYDGSQAFIQAIDRLTGNRLKMDVGGMQVALRYGPSATEGFYLDSSGKVGIGTTLPGYKLDVAGTANATQLCIAGDCKSTWPGASQWTTSGTNIYFNSGNVGIGTTTPGTNLEIKGSAGNTGVTIDEASGASSGQGPYVGLLQSGTLNAELFYNNNPNILVLSALKAGSQLLLRTGNVERVRIDASGNVGIGTTSPQRKLDVAGHMNTSGAYQIGGSTVLASIGNGNLLVGAGAGPNTNPALAGGNTFVGIDAGRNNAYTANTFVGSEAGYSNTVGYYNVAVGDGAGYSNAASFSNTSLGHRAGYSATGGQNTFVGSFAGEGKTTGGENSIVGYYAGGGGAASTGFQNAMLGGYAGVSNTSGDGNAFIGYRSGYSNTSGYANTFLGRDAGYSNQTGNYNVFLGFVAGYNETGSNKLYIANSAANPALIYGDFSSGRLGISTQAPQGVLHVEGTGNVILNTTGNVGIGTTIPASDHLLHVEGSGRIGAKIKTTSTGTDSFALWRVENNIGNTASFVMTGSNDAGQPWGANSAAIYSAGGPASMSLAALDPAGFLKFYTGGSNERMRITSGGNIGIGTTVPGERLDLAGAISQRAMASPAVSAAGQGKIYFDSTDNKFKVSENGAAFADLVAAGGGSQWTTSGANIYYNSGNVGIGTTNPTTKLHVLKDAGNGEVANFRAASTIADLSTYITLGKDGDVCNTHFVSDLGGTGIALGQHCVGYQLFVANSGNVGIGTTTPDKNLVVQGAPIPEIKVKTTSAGATSISIYRLENDIGRTASFVLTGSGDTSQPWGANSAAVYGDGNTDSLTVASAKSTGFLRFYTGGYDPTNERIRVTSAGNVGIGTTAPNSKLEVSGALRITRALGSSDLILQAESAGEPVFSAYLGATRSFGIRSNGIFHLGAGGLTTNGAIVNIDDTNGIFRGSFMMLQGDGANQYFFRSGHTAELAGRAAFVFDTSSTLATSDVAQFKNNGTKLLVVDKSGNVGIGTASPDSKLHVAGGVKIVDGTQGAGKVLTSDAGGLASWQTAAAGETNTFTSSKTFTSDVGLATQSGKVGIGTSNPQSALHIKSAGGGDNLFIEGNSGTDPGIVIKTGSTGSGITFKYNDGATVSYLQDSSGQMYIGNEANSIINFQGTNSTTLMTLRKPAFGVGLGIGIGASAPSATLHVSSANATATTTVLQVSSGTGTSQELVVVKGNGNVGIGTTSPNQLLDVQGRTSVSPNVTPALCIHTNDGACATTNAMGEIFMTPSIAGGPVQIRMASNAGNQILFYNQLRSAGGFIFNNGSSPNIQVGDWTGYPSAANSLFQVGISTFVALASGNVGIGTTSPLAILNVSGGSGATASFRVDGSSHAIFNQSGSVAVGTLAPAGKFHVRSSNGATTTPAILEVDANGANAEYLRFMAGPNSNPTLNNWGVRLAETNNGDLSFRDNATGVTRLFMASTNGSGYSGINTTSPQGYLHVTPFGVGGAPILILSTGAAASQEVVRVTNIGNVGIGTASPAQKFEVNGNIITSWQQVNASQWIGEAGAGGTVGANSGFAGMELESTTAGSGRNVHFHTNNPGVDSNRRLTIAYNGNVGIGTASPTQKLDVAGIVNASAFYVGGVPFAGGGSQWTTSGSIIYYNAGNVGIGTASPGAKLDVETTANGNQRLLTLRVPNVVGNNSQINFAVNSGGSNIDGARITTAYDAGSNVGLAFHTFLNPTLSEVMRLSSTGNVGIGTASPTVKLDVVGSNPAIRLKNTASALNSEIYANNDNDTASLTMSAFGSAQGGTIFGNSMAGAASFHTNVAGHLSVGTQNNVPLIFGTNDAERARITSAGNVGIGTSGPRAKLEIVNGSANTNGDSVSDFATVGADIPLPGTGSGNIFIQTNDAMAADKGGTLAFGGRTNTGGTVGAMFAAIKGAKENGTSTDTSGYLAFSTRLTGGGGNERMRITSAGYVGIGMTSPPSKLAITDGTGIAQFASVCGPSYIGLTLGQVAAPSCTNYNLLSSNADQGLYVNRPSGNPIQFREANGGSPQMTIAAGGNVGIGTASPAYKLDVAGDMNLAAGSSYRIGGVVQSASSKWTAGTGNDIYRSLGNVGIGMTSPRANLDVASGAVNISGDSPAELNITGSNLGATPRANAFIQTNDGQGAGVGGTLGFGGRFQADAGGAIFSIIKGAKENATSGNLDGYLAFNTRNHAAGNTFERMRITSTGNVGIGTTNPIVEFHLRDSGSNFARMFMQSSNNAAKWQISADGVAGGGGVAGGFRIFDDIAGQARLIINGSGNVGIGTSSPAAKLEVSGDVKISGGNYGLMGVNGYYMVAANTPTLLQVGSGLGWTDGIAFSPGSAEKMRISNAGNVGIGTATPAAKLDVAGSVKIADGTQGASKVLTSDAAGLASWQTPAAGGETNTYTSSKTFTSAVGLATQSGNVGIGTTGPRAKLEIVNGSANTNGDSVSDFAVVGADIPLPGTGSGNIFIQTNDAMAADKGGTLAFGGRTNTGSPAAAMFAAIKGAKENGTSTDTSGYLAFSTRLTGGGGNERMRITSAGNVGIGTTIPGSTVHISNNTRPQLLIEQPSGGGGAALDLKGYNNGGSRTWRLSTDVNVPGDFSIRVSGSTGGSPTTNVVVIDPAGKVGLGAGNPSNILSVTGNADFSGSVGIGTASPAALLHLSGANPIQRITHTDTASNGGIMFYEGGTFRSYIQLIGSTFGQASRQRGLEIGTLGDASSFIAFRPQDAEAMRITASGNVGIGTTIPSQKFQVVGGGVRVDTGTAVGSPAFFVNPANGLVGLGTSNPAAHLHVTGQNTAILIDASDPASSTANLDFNVVGTAQGKVYGYASRLWVNGTTGVTTRVANVDRTHADASGLTVYSNAAPTGFALQVSSQNTAGMLSVLGNGNVGIGTTSPGAKLHVFNSAGGGFNGNGNFRVESNVADSQAYTWYVNDARQWTTGVRGDVGDAYVIRDVTLGQERLAIDTAGNVGIGTTSPAAKLDVSGSVKIADGTQGASKVLTSDAAGLASWQTPAAVAESNTFTSSKTFTSAVGLATQSGNVGIGTTSPSTKLEVSGDIRTTSADQSIGARISAGNDNYLTSLVWNSGQGGVLTLGNNGNNEIRAGRTLTGGQMRFIVNNTAADTAATNGTEAIRILSGGNVGIGTTNPAATLDVNGPIRTNSEFQIDVDGGNITNTQGTERIIWTNRGAGGDILIKTASAERMRIANGGNVGVGTTAPGALMHVSGAAGIGATTNLVLVTTGTTPTNLFRVQANGNVYALGSIQGGGADVAEMYPAEEQVEAGDVVVLAGDGKVARSDGRGPIVGVVSTRPGTVLGWDIDKTEMPGQRPVALAGRVPVKATLENGPIRRGDALSPASKPGHAMRAAAGAPVIGMALEDLETPEGKVLCFVRVSDNPGGADILSLRRENETLRREIDELRHLVVGGRELK